MSSKKKKKKPIEKYRTLKCSLDQILLFDSNINYAPLASAIDRTNKLVTVCYLFIRLFILYKINKKETLVPIRKDTVCMAFKVISNKSVGPKPTGDNLKIYNEFELFYNQEFGKLINFNKIDRTNLSAVTDICETDIVTNIETNIKCHFISHLRGFVNRMFKQEHSDILYKLTGTEKYEKKAEFARELNKLKLALINNNLECDEKYHIWLKTYRTQILPTDYFISYYRDIKRTPQKYLPYMAAMNVLLEERGLKQFQFCPLRTDITSKYMPLDTKALIDLTINKNKNKYLKDVEQCKYEVWSSYFNLSDKIFKVKDYTFDNAICTDGFSVSIRFLHNSHVEIEKKKKLDNRNRVKKAKELYKGKTEKQIQTLKDAKIEKQVKRDDDFSKALEEKRKKNKEAFNKLSKEEKDKIELEKKRNRYVEFPYIDELAKDDLEELKKVKRVYIDPGKRSLFYMIDDEGNILNYTNKTRIRETKRIKYNKLRENYKKRNRIEEFETDMSEYNSKTCNYTKFKEYITKKYELNNKLFEFYNSTDYFKKLKWYSYINTKRSEANLINKIKEVYGEDIIIIIGDWSNGKQMRNFISTPNLGLKRVLSSEFTVYDFDEFRTSCLNYKTEERCKNLYLPDTKNRLRKIHAVLTFQMENKRMGCINRDKNGVNNIRKLVNHYLKTGKRLPNYSRTVKLEDGLKTKKGKNKDERFEPLEKRSLSKREVGSSSKMANNNRKSRVHLRIAVE